MWFCLSPLQLETPVQPLHTQLTALQWARAYAHLQNIRQRHTFSPYCDIKNSCFCSVIFFFLLGWSKSGVRAFVWHSSITSGQWCIPQQRLTNATSAHVFLFTTKSEGTHHPACYYPAPSTTMSPFSAGSTRGKNGLLSMNTMRCGQTRSIVEGWGEAKEERGDSQREAFTTPAPQLN